jgi:hypothetical protein
MLYFLAIKKEICLFIVKIQCNFYKNLARVVETWACIHGINMIIFWNIEIQFLNILKTRSNGAHVHQICFTLVPRLHFGD